MTMESRESEPSPVASDVLTSVEPVLGVSSSAEGQAPVRIVGIGASAGGLEPLKEFFRATTANPLLAFVVVTHLPAHHVSHMAELLDRVGALRVSQALEGEQVAGGHVYHPARHVDGHPRRGDLP